MNYFVLINLFFLNCVNLVLSQEVKGFYVNNFYSILGNEEKEDSLLNFAQLNTFNYLTLYEMQLVHANSSLTDPLTSITFAQFVSKAKTQYGILEIGVAGENDWFFETIIHEYNLDHGNQNEQIDVYNLEFEFWIPSSNEVGGYYCDTYLDPNNLDCDTSGGFQFYLKTLKKIDSLANTIGKKSEAYFGFFNDGQASQVIQTGVDRIFLSTYVPSASYSASYQYGYLLPRLESLGLAQYPITILPLYSSESIFMQNWLESNNYFSPYQDLEMSLLNETAPWKNMLNLEGIQWFAYGFMPNLGTSYLKEKTESETIISIYPNPFERVFTISFETGSLLPARLSLHGMDGKMVYSENQLISEQHVISPNLEPGIYFIHIYFESKQIVKMVVMN